MPSDARPDLDRRWVSWEGTYLWPPNSGFAGAPAFTVLPAGTMVDRFGDEGGNFLSVRGAAYAARSLPFACKADHYHAYLVTKPLPVWVGRAAPWFGQEGDATQIRTDASIAMLRSDGHLQPVHNIEPVKCP